MTKILSYIGIVVLVIIAIVLGYTIYQQQTGTKTPASSIGGQSQTRTITQKPELTAKEKEVLKFPDSNTSEAEKNTWGEKVQSLAKTAEVLEVNNCITSPTVLFVKNGSEIKVKNNGQTEFTLFVFGSEYRLAPGSSTSIKVDSKEGGGNYGYRCGFEGGPKIPEISGIFLLI